MERVCAACWRSATREVQRHNLHDSNRPAMSDAVSTGDFNIPQPPPLPQQSHQTAQIRPNVSITSSV